MRCHLHHGILEFSDLGMAWPGRRVLGMSVPGMVDLALLVLLAWWFTQVSGIDWARHGGFGQESNS